MSEPRIDLSEVARQAPEDAVRREGEVLEDAPPEGGLVPQDDAQSAPPVE